MLRGIAGSSVCVFVYCVRSPNIPNLALFIFAAGPSPNRLQPLLRRRRGGQPAYVEASPTCLRQVEQVHRVLPGFQHARRNYPRGHGQVRISSTEGQNLKFWS
jgi:hypothetical protein